MSFRGEKHAAKFIKNDRIPDYPYEPLREACSEIRLLQFIGPLDHNPDYLECRLEHVPYKETSFSSNKTTIASSWGPFVALSYAWGKRYFHDKDRRLIYSWIVLNGYITIVHPNLFEALKGLRKLMAHGLCTVRRFWVDAICINQKDVVERSRQVVRMRHIFGEASLVYCFPTTYWEEQTSHALSPLAIRIDPDLTTSTLRTYAELKAKDTEEYIAGLRQRASSVSPDFSPQEEQSFANLYRFFASPYWARVWIIQEIALAPENALFIILWQSSVPWDCESGTRCDTVHILPWTTIAQAAKFVEDAKYPIEGLMMSYGEGTRLKAWPYWYIIRRIEAMRVRRPRVLDGQALASSHGGNDHWTIGLVRRSLSNDARDKVYGILSLLPADVAIQIDVDYSKPVAEVYTDFATTIINTSGTVQILPHGAASIMDDVLPSWVPDLTNPNVVRPFRVVCKVWGDLRLDGLDFRPSVVGRTLTAFGLILDTLENVTAAPDTQNLPVLSEIYLASLISQPVKQPETEAKLLKTLLSGIRPNDNQPERLPRFAYQSLTRHGEMLFDLVRANREFMLPSGYRLCDMFETCVETSNAPDQDLYIGEIDYQLGLRKLATTQRGNMALVSPASKPGDVVCALVGRNDLGILREVDGGEWRWVGNAYIEGFMQGEAVREHEREMREFKIV